jgi:hypothetical protein
MEAAHNLYQLVIKILNVTMDNSYAQMEVATLIKKVVQMKQDVSEKLLINVPVDNVLILT